MLMYSNICLYHLVMLDQTVTPEQVIIDFQSQISQIRVNVSVTGGVDKL